MEFRVKFTAKISGEFPVEADSLEDAQDFVSNLKGSDFLEYAPDIGEVQSTVTEVE